MAKSAPERPSYYQTMIAEITGAPRRSLQAIEHVMRYDVVQNPISLDFLDDEDFRLAAVEAYQVYLDNRELYDSVIISNRAAYKTRCAATVLADAEKGGEVAAIRSARTKWRRAARAEEQALKRFEAASIGLRCAIDEAATGK